VEINFDPGSVSIGMPVRNASRFLRGALDALLAQDYKDFKIFISDNASVDETENICRQYASADARIHYHRLETDQGAIWNFNHVYKLARGEYFMWAAHDDLRSPDYLSRCVAALEQNPDAIVCCTGVEFIDTDGRDITESFNARTLAPAGNTATDRLRSLARSTFWVDIYSLFRARVVAEVVPLERVWGGDLLFMGDIFLRGRAIVIPERLFQYRLFAEKSGEIVAQNLNISLSWIYLIVDMLGKIAHAGIGLIEKCRASWTFVVEFGFRNDVVAGYIQEEGFRGVRHAVGQGRPGRAFVGCVLASLLLAPERCRRLIASLRERFQAGSASNVSPP
jgi:glycosyltransferase involved in cell wall biosynthesis